MEIQQTNENRKQRNSLKLFLFLFLNIYFEVEPITHTVHIIQDSKHLYTLFIENLNKKMKSTLLMKHC